MSDQQRQRLFSYTDSSKAVDLITEATDLKQLKSPLASTVLLLSTLNIVFFGGNRSTELKEMKL